MGRLLRWAGPAAGAGEDGRFRMRPLPRLLRPAVRSRRAAVRGRFVRPARVPQSCLSSYCHHARPASPPACASCRSTCLRIRVPSLAAAAATLSAPTCHFQLSAVRQHVLAVACCAVHLLRVSMLVLAMLVGLRERCRPRWELKARAGSMVAGDTPRYCAWPPSVHFMVVLCVLHDALSFKHVALVRCVRS